MDKDEAARREREAKAKREVADKSNADNTQANQPDKNEGQGEGAPTGYDRKTGKPAEGVGAVRNSNT